MTFWKNNTSSNDSTDMLINQQAQERLDLVQHSLFLARRRVLGAAVLLSLSFAFLPWVLDDVKRNWDEDVILRMPKNEEFYKNRFIKDNTNHTNNAIKNIIDDK